MTDSAISRVRLPLSGAIPPYLKPTSKRRKRPYGRRPGHKGISRKRPENITACQTHTLESCPDCQQPLQKQVRTHKRYIEDIPRLDPVVTEHTIHGSWCSCCKKIVQPTVTDALPAARLGLRLVVFTAWLHYLVGISVNNIVKIVSVFFNLHVSASGLIQAWKALATLLERSITMLGKSLRKRRIARG